MGGEAGRQWRWWRWGWWGWGTRLETDRKTSQGALSSAWRALDENVHSPIEASISQGRKSSFRAVNHLLGGHGQGPVMLAHMHFIRENLDMPTRPPRPVMPAADLASQPTLSSLPLFFPPPACTSNAVWRLSAWDAGPSCPQEEPDCTLDQALSCPHRPTPSQLLTSDVRLHPIFIDPAPDAKS